MSREKCTSWLGHRFEGRYSEKPGPRPTVNDLLHSSFEQGRMMIRASVIRTYERDVCVRCGAAVEKPTYNPDRKEAGE